MVGPALGAIVISMIAIGQAWPDARAGTAVNAVVLIGVIVGFAAQGPLSLRAHYEHDVDKALPAAHPAGLVDERAAAHLPLPVRRYLRATGVIGQPRVQSFRARVHGRIRNGPQGSWMPIAAEQYNVIDRPARLFYFTGTMRGLPVQGFHRYLGSTASMVVKAAGLIPVVDESGPVMDRAETVTLFNDMCVIAPATLVDRRIEWTPVDDLHARARFTSGDDTITAELVFNEQGELVDFQSDDRYAVQPDGAPPRRMPWSTPVGTYRQFGAVRLPSGGAGIWHEATGKYTYIELTIDEVEYNPAR